jgi:glycosyltransferase involved in cell wall biosynthesis
MSSFNISLCMLVKNEEEFLEQCLQSASPFVYEMIIIDTGSSDRTVEIATKFGARVISVEWEDDFAAVRNIALSYASCTWVLILDADELLAPPNMTLLHQLLKNNSVSGYYLKVHHYFGEKNSNNLITETTCRLFRKLPEAIFKGIIHEDISLSLMENFPEKEILFADISIYHFGYLEEVIEKKGKRERNIRLLKKGTDLEPENLYYRYALGNEYFGLGQYNEAIIIYSEILPKVTVTEGYASDLLFKSIYAYKEEGQKEKAMDLGKQGLCFYPDFVDLIALYSHLLIEDGKFEEAKAHLTRCLKTGDVSDKYMTIKGVNTFHSHYLLGIVHERLYNWKESMQHYECCMQIAPNHIESYNRWLDLAFLILPKQKILLHLYEQFDQMDSDQKWRNYFYYALKWGIGGEALDVLNIMDSDHEEILFIRSIALAQSGDYNQSIRLLKSLIDRNSLEHYYIYYWALTCQSDESINLDIIIKLSEISTEYVSIVERLQKRHSEGITNEQTYRQLIYALLQVKAWGPLLYVMDQLLPTVKKKLSREWFPLLHKAPLEVKKRIVSLIDKEYESINYEEQLFYVLMSVSINQLNNAYDRLIELKQKHPTRLEPIVGLSSIYSQNYNQLIYYLLAET